MYINVLIYLIKLYDTSSIPSLLFSKLRFGYIHIDFKKCLIIQKYSNSNFLNQIIQFIPTPIYIDRYN